MCAARCKKCNDYNINLQNQQCVIQYNFNVFLRPFNEVNSFQPLGRLLVL